MRKGNNIHNIYRYKEKCVIYLLCIHQCLVDPSKMATPEKKGTQPSKMRSFAMQRQSAEQSMRLPWSMGSHKHQVSQRKNQPNPHAPLVITTTPSMIRTNRKADPRRTQQSPLLWQMVSQAAQSVQLPPGNTHAWNNYTMH